ncbi:MAG TPA: MalM family protein [Burkholderiales bacterium]
MKKTMLIILLFACVLVSSCASDKPVDPVKSDLETAAVCCASYEQFYFQPLKLGATESATIDRSSTAFLFDGGKSYFKAFSLPVAAKPYFVIVSSYFVDKEKRSGEPYIFSPVVMFLDADYHVTRKVDNGIVIPINSGNSMNHAWLEMEIAMNPRAAGERFMVIYTTTALLNQATLLKVNKNATIGWIVDDYPVQNAPIGRLQVNLTSWRQ